MARMKKENSKDNFLVAWGIYGAIGFQLAGMVIGGLLAGQWVDKKLGFTPWFTLIGLIVGSIGGFYNLIRMTQWKGKKGKGP